MIGGSRIYEEAQLWIADPSILVKRPSILLSMISLSSLHEAKLHFVEPVSSQTNRGVPREGVLTPVGIQHVDEVEATVEHGQQQIRDGQVH